MLKTIQPRPGKLKILLAEDSADDAFFFRRTLKKTLLDCDLTHVLNGAGAIEFLTQNNEQILPDIIFLDLKMPIVSGFDVLNWIGQERLSRPVRVIVLSGSNDAADRRRATELGAADYVVKPISAVDMTNHLNDLCSADQGRAQSIEF